MAAVVVALPAELVNTARKRRPLSGAAAVKLYVVDVADGMLLKFAPPSVLTCHCAVGVGSPLAKAVKDACCPAETVRLDGFCVMEGATGPPGFTVSVAAVVVAVPAELVNTARNR